MPIFYNNPWYPTIYKHVTSEGITFTKTSVIDKTQLPNKIVFNEDYSNYDLLLFVAQDSTDNSYIEFLTTPEMLQEIYVYSVSGYGHAVSFVKNGTNYYVNFYFTSNTEFSRYNSRNLTIVDVFAISCNRAFTKTMLFTNQSITPQGTAITTQQSIFDYDFLIISCCSGQWEQITVSNIPINISYQKTFQTVISASCARYNQGLTPIQITEYGITAAPFFAVQGIKFT